MKNAITFLVLLFGGMITAHAQTFTTTPNDSAVGTYDVNDWAQDYIHFENNTGSPLTLSFQTISNQMTPFGWNVVMCTSNGCYPYVPATGSLGTLADGDTAHIMVQCGFMGIAGTKHIRVRVYETGNPSNADTVTYRYTAVSTAGITDNGSANNALSQNYPNPFSGTTMISYNLDGENGEIVITDLSGKTISTYVLNQNSGQVLVSDIPAGIYFYSLYSEGTLVASRKMIVQ